MRLVVFRDVKTGGRKAVKRFAFPKSRRLVANSQFRAVLARRLSARDELLVLYACENNLGCPRLGVSIGKSCKKAVVRNRIKRLLREAFRQNQHLIPQGFDYVVLLSPRQLSMSRQEPSAGAGAKSLAFEQLRDSFLALSSRLAARMA